VLTSAHALEACSAACPLHCLRARGDVRLSSELSPSLTHSPGAAPPAPRRGRSRGLCALPTRGSAGGRHHRHSRASRDRSLPPRLYGKGGGRRARVCGCVRPDDGEAAAPQPLCSKRAPRRGLASPASPTRASCSVLGEAPARGGEPPGPSRPLAAPPPPSHAATAAVSFCATRRSCSLPPTRLRRRCVLRCDPPRWQQRALLVPLPASGPGATGHWASGHRPSGHRASGHVGPLAIGTGTLRPSGHCVHRDIAWGCRHRHARRAVLVLASARALKACSTACPLHYLYARGGSQSWQSPSQSCQSPSQPSHTVCLRLPWSKCRSRGLPTGKDPPRPSRNCYLAERGGAA